MTKNELQTMPNIKDSGFIQLSHEQNPSRTLPRASDRISKNLRFSTFFNGEIDFSRILKKYLEVKIKEFDIWRNSSG